MRDIILELSKEKHDLEIKIGNLQKFIASENFSKIKTSQGRLLLIQIQAMETYREVLDIRIVDMQDKV
jgi:translation initiation factor IF-3